MMYKPAEVVDVIINANNTMNNATIMPNMTTPLTVINNTIGVWNGSF